MKLTKIFTKLTLISLMLFSFLNLHADGHKNKTGPELEYFGTLSYADITRINVALVAGFQLMLAARWSLAIQTNIVAHNRWTYKPESGGEFKNDFTNFFFNKNNLLTLSLIFHLKKRQ